MEQVLISRRIKMSFIGSAIALAAVLTIGTIGYRIIGGPQYSLLDCFYMTFTTIATIGFGELIDMSHKPEGRVFTIIIASVGIGAFLNLFSTTTAFILEGDMNQALRRRRMHNLINRLRNHYIVCGIGRVGGNVAHELVVTERDFVAIENDTSAIARFEEKYPDHLYLHGDGGDDELLLKAGIQHAAGIFAVTGDDNQNIVIALTAKQLNPAVRVVARCHEVRNIEKAKKAGADVTVSPDFTGGMRIASAMIRPAAVTFLDEMLKSHDGLRVEEIHVPDNFAGCCLSDLGASCRDYLCVAVREQGSWRFNPEPGFPVKPGDVLVVMANPGGRQQLEKFLGASPA
jgi:voltage-gated potassium channel